MKCKTVIFAVLVGLIAVVLGFFATLPVPEDLPEPWRIRACKMNQITLVYFGALFLRILGLEPALNATRNVTDVVFDEVPVRIYLPHEEHSEPLPALVFLHGGGWIVGSVDSYHPVVNDIATKLDQVLLVSVDYRLAPLHPFPAAIDDCTKAIVWLLSHTKEYNVDPGRIGIFGDSAGGNLAAAVSQRLTFDSKYTHLPKIRLQALIYPPLQAVDFEMPSHQQHGSYFILMSKRLGIWCWGQYLAGYNSSKFEAAAASNNHTSSSAKISMAKQGIVSHDIIPKMFKSKGYIPPRSSDFGDEMIYDSIKDTLMNPDFAPLMRTDLRGLPEAYIATCYFDLVRDDGIIYAKRLQNAGVEVTWKHYEVGIHGGMTDNHDGICKLESGRQMRQDLITYLKQSLMN